MEQYSILKTKKKSEGSKDGTQNKKGKMNRKPNN